MCMENAEIRRAENVTASSTHPLGTASSSSKMKRPCPLAISILQ